MTLCNVFKQKMYSRVMIVVIVVFIALLHLDIATGNTVSYIAQNLGIKYEVVANVNGNAENFDARLTLSNTGPEEIRENSWDLYFTSLYMVEPNNVPFKPNGYAIPGCGFSIIHVNGGLFKLKPTSIVLSPGDEKVCDFKVQHWSVSRTDFLPRWYVSDGVTSQSIVNTDTERLSSFTGNFDTLEKWKRYENDQYNPWTPGERWDRNEIPDLGHAPKWVIPTPKTINTDSTNNLQLPLIDWVVYISTNDLQDEANILNKKFHWRIETNNKPNKTYAVLMLNDKTGGEQNSEEYELKIDASAETIIISSTTTVGVYYGVQTLISILETKPNGLLPSITANDSPRYWYRGMHIDVARNFVPFNDIIKLIEVMGMYKLNKLHFHLTDDEGWRLQMNWCPQLIEVAAKRCHDPTEQKCLIPQLGSDPNTSGSGSGFYSVEEYKEILRVAESHHIEVIPEIDMPGHARAAIKATEAFEKTAMGTIDSNAAKEIKLSDPGDTSIYLSTQYFTDNAVNPCQNTTYTFIRKALQSLIEYHRDIQPLKTFHLGGDEVARTAWTESPKCDIMIASSDGFPNSTVDLAEYFMRRASGIVSDVDSNLTLGLWEDGAIDIDEDPFVVSEFKTKEVLVHAWQNIWEWGAASRAYKLANAGYKVVMSQATSLYFDHPYEPDPEERGLYWATRYIDTQKTFGFMPDNLYANVDTTREGIPLTEKELCETTECVPLQKKENIIGIQGQIWSETIRNSEQLFGNIFPRFLALAERAWHKAEWEEQNNKDMRMNDWVEFANTIGYKELKRLDDIGVSYRVPVAGAKVQNNLVHANSEFPGLEITYSTATNPFAWSKYAKPLGLDDDIFLQIRSGNGAKGGRIVTVPKSSGKSVHSGYILTISLLFSFCCLWII